VVIVVKEFINILISVCKGTSLFPTLLHVPFLRALFHLFLLSSLTSIFIVLAQIAPTSEAIDRSVGALEQNFGILTFTKEGIRTSKPMIKTEFDVAGGNRIQCFPDADSITSDVVYDSLAESGVVVSRTFIFMWTKVDDDMVVPIWFGAVSNAKQYFSKRLNRTDFEQFLAEGKAGGGDLTLNTVVPILYSDLLGADDLAYQPVEFSDLGSSFLIQSSFFYAIIWGCVIFIKVLWYSLMFMGIFFLMNRRLLGKIPFRSFFIMSIYVGFPAVIVAALFPALDLPYLDYETVYYIGFLVYLFPVLGRVQNDINTPKSRSA